MRVWQALALASAMLTGRIEPASTARCSIPVSVSEELQKSDAVFAGKVIAKEYRPLKTPAGEGEVLTVRIAVEKWWKGGKSEEVTLFTSSENGAPASSRAGLVAKPAREDAGAPPDFHCFRA